VLLTLLIATSLTRPISDMAHVVRTITEQGEARSFGRVPTTESDELGELVLLTNDMIQRLELARMEREVALTELEKFAESLEVRVAERTQERDEQIAHRARLELEVTVAQRIQRALLPRTFSIEGLDLAARMVPASEVGGDYFDILPVERGGFISIGDVSGHGLGAGLIMLMLQSITTTLVESFPKASSASAPPSRPRRRARAWSRSSSR
jgi:serine phosphatase RsbU (regulator of sigma subunit)